MPEAAARKRDRAANYANYADADLRYTGSVHDVRVIRVIRGLIPRFTSPADADRSTMGCAMSSFRDLRRLQHPTSFLCGAARFERGGAAGPIASGTARTRRACRLSPVRSDRRGCRGPSVLPAESRIRLRFRTWRPRAGHGSLRTGISSHCSSRGLPGTQCARQPDRFCTSRSPRPGRNQRGRAIACGPSAPFDYPNHQG